eukprot:4552445-Amphidinium_carterae.1
MVTSLVLYTPARPVDAALVLQLRDLGLEADVEPRDFPFAQHFEDASAEAETDNEQESDGGEQESTSSSASHTMNGTSTSSTSLHASWLATEHSTATSASSLCPVVTTRARPAGQGSSSPTISPTLPWRDNDSGDEDEDEAPLTLLAGANDDTTSPEDISKIVQWSKGL